MNAVGLISSGVCLQAVQSICEFAYRVASRQISEKTGLSISSQGVWNLIQQVGKKQEEAVERYSELS